MNEREEWELPGGQIEVGEGSPKRLACFPPGGLPQALPEGYRRSIEAATSPG